MDSVKRYFVPVGGRWHIDFLSGLTVALALIPEAIAFALVATLDPRIGLYAAFFMCLITAVIGGRPGMISGATGSMAVVMVNVVMYFNQYGKVHHLNHYGVEMLFATIILTGMIQILFGLLHLGKFIRMMPKSVMVGFVNGLAIVIFMAQLKQFYQPGSHQTVWLHGVTLYTMIGLAVLAMFITHYLPKLTKKVPSALTAIVVVTLIVLLGHVHTPVVRDMMQSSTTHSAAALPSFHIPMIHFNLHNMGIVFVYAFMLAIIGISESLMTLSLIDEKTQTHGKSNRECIAQGIANIVSGFFKSMGGCAMIGQSMINIGSGGRGRLSGIVAGVFLLLFIIVFWAYIQMIPLAALVGVMFMVVFETFEWATFKFIRKIPLHDALIIIIVTAVTVLVNLAVAVLVGVILACLVFAWQTAKKIHAEEIQLVTGTKEYLIHGPLFFGCSTNFKRLFEPQQDPNTIIIDFKYSRVTDHSAIDAIKYVVEQYTQNNKHVHLRHLSPECKLLLGKAGDMVDINVLEDPDYHVVTDKLD